MYRSPFGTAHLREKMVCRIFVACRLRDWYEGKLKFQGGCLDLQPGQTIFRRCRKSKGLSHADGESLICDIALCDT